MADNTTRPNTTGGDVIRSEDETSAKTQVFRLEPRIVPVTNASASLLEQIRDAKLSRNELLRALQGTEGRGAGAPPPPFDIPDTRTIQDILGSRLYRWYRSYSVGTWSCALGSGDATQGTAVNQPTVGTFPISGNTYPIFDGAAGTAADYVTIPTLSTLPTYTSADFFIQGGLINISSNPDGVAIVSKESGLTNDDTVQVNTNTLGFDGTFNSATNVNGTGWARWIIYMISPTTCNVYVNGALDTGAASAALGNLWKTNTFVSGSAGAAGGSRIVGSLASMFWGRSNIAFTTQDILALDGALKRFMQ